MEQGIVVEKPDSTRPGEVNFVIRSDKSGELSFSCAVRDLEVWQKILLSVAAVGMLAIVGFILREILYAVHPDRRPLKRKRRSRDGGMVVLGARPKKSPAECATDSEKLAEKLAARGLI